MEKKVCLDCGETIKGRSDKKFCNDICRNSYNNKLNSDTTNYVRNVNNILRKNRRVLEELIPEERLDCIKTFVDLFKTLSKETCTVNADGTLPNTEACNKILNTIKS